MDELVTGREDAMVAKGKGILAADESSGTIKKRFDAIGVNSTEDNRRDYRELLFRTDGDEGAHLRRDPVRRDDPAERRRTARRWCKVIGQSGAVPGIKVDKGTKPLAGCPGEVITEGLDGLRERLREYHKLGARFAKWRAVIDIGTGIPSYTASKRTRMRWRATRRFARRTTSCPSSSRKC